MSIGHLLYIPLIGLVGMAFGYVLGAQATRRHFEKRASNLKGADVNASPSGVGNPTS